MSKLILVMLMLTASSAFADQSAPALRPTVRFGVQRPQSDPYKQLFAPPKGVQPSIERPALAAKPKVVCGMTIIPADPSLDPKMTISPKDDRNLKYAIRSVDPPICNPSR